MLGASVRSAWKENRLRRQALQDPSDPSRDLLRVLIVEIGKHAVALVQEYNPFPVHAEYAHRRLRLGPAQGRDAGGRDPRMGGMGRAAVGYEYHVHRRMAPDHEGHGAATS